MKDRRHNVQGFIFLLIAVASHGFYGVFSRVIGPQFGQIYQVVARSAILLIFFSLLVVIRGGWKQIRTTDYKWYLFMIFPGLVALVSMFTAFNNLPLGTVLFTYFAVSTLGSYTLGFIMYKEQIDKIKIISLVLSFVGLYFVFSNSIKPGNILYFGFACLAGLGAAAWTTVSKKISSTYSTVQILVVDNLLMVVVGLPISFLLQEPVSWPSLTLPWLGILGYAAAAIGSGIFTIKGFKNLQAQTGSLILLMEPVFGAVIGWMLYKEALHLLTFIGALFILTGAALPQISFRPLRLPKRY